MGAESRPALDKIEEMIQGFFWMLPNIGIALAVVLAFFLLGYGAKRSVRRVLGRRGRGDLGVLLSGFARWGIVLVGVMVAATIVFPSITPASLFSTLGIGSVAIGFAFKDILQNWFAGLLILYRQPFRSGDQIKSGDFEGTVEHIEARATLLRTYDGQRVVIPNSDIYTRAITIRTAFPIRRSDYDVSIGYGDDIERARDILLATVRGVEGVQPEPGVEVIPWEFDASSVNLRVRWWTKSIRREVVHTRGRVIAAVKRALAEAAIDQPFPTRTILFHDQTEPEDHDRRSRREGWPAPAGADGAMEEASDEAARSRGS
ncbi:MAG TPA: mechanosensitive ion channel family protein [Beijerinckiaceae bacterium]|jgi:small-conductance mechanosensitive channel